MFNPLRPVRTNGLILLMIIHAAVDHFQTQAVSCTTENSPVSQNHHLKDKWSQNLENNPQHAEVIYFCVCLYVMGQEALGGWRWGGGGQWGNPLTSILRPPPPSPSLVAVSRTCLTRMPFNWNIIPVGLHLSGVIPVGHHLSGVTTMGHHLSGMSS